MLAGQVEIRMLAELAQLKRDMDGAKRIVSSAVSDINTMLNRIGFGLASGLSIGGIVALAKSTIDAISRFKELGQEAGISASAISKFEAPARAAGSSLEGVATAIFNMSKALVDARDPQSKQAQAIRAIGLNVDQLLKMKPDEAFELIARQMAKYSDGFGKNVAMQTIFNKGGREMSKVLAEIAERGQLQATVTDEQAEAANKFNNRLLELKMTSESAFRDIANQAMPAMQNIVKSFQDAAKEGGILKGIIAGLAQLLSEMNGPGERLKQANQEIKNYEEARKTQGMFFGPGAADGFKKEKEYLQLLEKRKGILKEIADLGIKEQDQRIEDWQRAGGKMDGMGPKKKPNVNLNFASEAETKLYTSALQKLEEELGKLNGMTEVQKITYETTKGSLMTLTEEHKKHLLVVAAEIDAKRTAIALAASEVASLEAQIAKRDDAAQKISAFNKAQKQILLDMQFELSLAGKTSAARQKATLMRNLETDAIAMMAGMEGEELKTAQAVYEMRKKQLDEGFVSQKAIDQLADLLDPERVRTFGDAWADAFGSAGKSLAGLMNEMEKMSKKEAEFAEMRKAAAKIDDEAERKKALIAITEEQTRTQIGSYAAMAGAAKGFFKEGTTGYKALDAAQKAFTLVQLAMDLQRGLSAAAVAIATQAQGEPYSAWARMAMMAAAMAALGFAVAGIASRGGSGQTAAEMQAAQGRGSVLGDSSAQSESIAHSMKIIAENSDAQLTYQSAMAQSLRSIDAAMSGLATLLARSLGVSNATNTPVKPNQLPGQLSGAAMGAAMGAVVGTYVFPVIGTAIGAVIGAVLGALGGRVSATLTNIGVHIADQTIGMAREAFRANQFQTVHTQTSFFGINMGGHDTTTPSPLSPEVLHQFTMIVDGIANTLVRAAQVLAPAGTDLTAFGNQVNDFLNALTIDAGDVSLKDLKGDELQKALEAVFGKIGDEMTRAVLDRFLPGVTDFQHVGEGLFETMVRVASGVERASAVLNLWGIAVVDWNLIANKQGDVTEEMIRTSVVAFETSADGVVSGIGQIIDAFAGTTDEMITLYNKLRDLSVVFRAAGLDVNFINQAVLTAAGGYDRLNAGATAYAERFFSREERAAAATAELSLSFQRIGVAVPASRAAFRALVEAAAAAGDEEMVGRLLAVAPAFDEVASAGEDAAARLTQAWSDFSDLVDKLTGRNSRARMQAQLEGMTSSLGSSNSMFAGMSPEQVITAISTLTEGQFKGFDDATQKLIIAILQLALNIKDLDGTVQNTSLYEHVTPGIPRSGTPEEWFQYFMKNFDDKFAGVIAGNKTPWDQLNSENRLIQEQMAAWMSRKQYFEDVYHAGPDKYGNPQEYTALLQLIDEMNKRMAMNSEDLVTLAKYRGLYGDDKAGSLLELDKWYAAQKDLVGTSQQGLLELERIFQEKRKAIIEGGNDNALDGLRNFLKGLLTGDLSPLTNEQKLAELKKNYEEALTGGKYDEIQSSAQAYLQLARQMYASSPLYNAIFGEVFNQIDALAGTGLNWQDAITNAMPTTSTIASSDDIADLKQAVVDVGHEMARTNAQSATDIANTVNQRAATGYYAPA